MLHLLFMFAVLVSGILFFSLALKCSYAAVV
jgi:hypothetical protein